MKVLFARLSCTYSGRVDANLSLGDYLLMLRDPRMGGDGSCLVYSTSKGLGARNWMPPGSTLIENEQGFIIEHRPRGEKLEIYIEQIHWQGDALPSLEGELVKMGAEREFSDLLSLRLHMLGGGLELIGREERTPAGPIDLLLLEDERPVAVEVKRQRVTPADAWQLRRYLHAITTMPEWDDAPPPRGILVAPVLAKKAKELIDGDEQLSFVRVTYPDLCTAITDEELLTGKKPVIDLFPIKTAEQLTAEKAAKKKNKKSRWG
jgi:endonuclease